MHARAGEHAPCLAWLAKPLKFCNFSVCSLIELKISVIGPYNFLQWNLRFSRTGLPGLASTAWLA